MTTFAAPVKSLYRMGVPVRYSSPVYEALIQSLNNHGYIVGENLELVQIDMQAARIPENRKAIRDTIMNKTDMMFITCDKLKEYFQLDVKIPTLFFGPKGMNYYPPEDIKPYLTGVWRGDMSDVLRQVDRMIPDGKYHSIGVPYIIDTNFEDILPYIEKSAVKVGVEIKTKGYRTEAELIELMKEFSKTAKTVFFFPPAIKDDYFDSILSMQKSLKLPALGQMEKHVEGGMVAGVVLNMSEIVPKLTEYVDKILNGRKPSQLRVFTSNLKHIINLEAVSNLNVKISRDVVKRSEIIGVAQASKNFAVPNQKQLIPGNFTIGMTDSIIGGVRDRVIQDLKAIGYFVGKNLKISHMNLGGIGTSNGRLQILKQLKDIDVLFITDNAAYDFVALKTKTPVVLLGISDINDIPDNMREYFSGVWRASCRKVLNMAKQMFPNVKRIGMAYRSETRMEKIINHHQSVAQKEKVELQIESYRSDKDIPSLMKRFDENVDIVLLFPAGVVDNDIAEFIRMQNELKLPVLSHLQHHVRMGLVGGPTVDLNVVGPKLAEMIHKILQGRLPSQLKTYQYTPRYTINLKAAKDLDVKIPRGVIRQSDIIN